jgi:hypothetical protein
MPVPCCRPPSTDAGIVWLQVAEPDQLFTLFLTNPVLAFFRLTGCPASAELLLSVDKAICSACNHLCQRVQDTALGNGDSGEPASPWAEIFADPFAERLIVRFALCRAALARLQAGPDEAVCVAGEAIASPELPVVLAADDEGLLEHINEVLGLVQAKSLKLGELTL